MLNDSKVRTLEEVKGFLAGSQKVDFNAAGPKAEAYEWVQSALLRLGYQTLSRSDKGLVIEYLKRVTGYSRAQIRRLIGQYQKTGKIKLKVYSRQLMPKKYSKKDIRLLAEIDRLHQHLNGLATKKICERAYLVFKKEEYKILSEISASHIYNIRQTKTYRTCHQHYTKTQPTKSKIGIRKKPRPNGQPGYIRVDSVHQGDRNGIKGVYHINAVDEVTQFEIVSSVEKISEAYLLPVIQQMLDGFPFKIKGFHSDNGSEYVNHKVSDLLNKLLIEFTKSRPRHSNDNAIAECKNGAIVRKQFGYDHIPQRFATKINIFNMDHLNPYINFHRPCCFSTVVRDARGKEKKTYRSKNVETPYEKFKSLPDAERHLKKGVTFAVLDAMALSLTDNEAADLLNQKKRELFSFIQKEISKE